MNESGNASSGVERPDGWPESFSDQGSDPNCPHYYQWGDGRDAYKCIYCEHVLQEPPERKLQTDTEHTEENQ